MNEYAPIAEAIKARVSMQDAIALYAPNPTPKHHRIPCPIHNGDNYNLHFSDNLYHCFVCGEGGDVISFVRHIYKLDFLDALRKLNDDFGLSLPIDRRPTLREQCEAETKQRELLAERAKADAEKRNYDTLYNLMWDEYAKLDKQLIDLAPTNPDEDFNPLYVEAVKNIRYIEYLIDVLL